MSSRLAQGGLIPAQHDRGLAVTGTRSEADRSGWDRKLAEIAALPLAGEDVPAAPPPVVSNTRAAVAAYAEAVSDGMADELRRCLFRAIWVQGRHLSSAYEVRRLITRLMWRPEAIRDRLASPDIPGLLDYDPDLARIVRPSGGTIAPDGGPLTTADWRRIWRWREDWLALPSQVIPAVTGPDKILRSGTDGLRYLADFPGVADMTLSLPAGAEAESAPGRPAARAA